jgi:hypothetical protein
MVIVGFVLILWNRKGLIMRPLVPEIIMISSDVEDSSPEFNSLRQVIFETHFENQDIKYIPAIGCYKGKLEKSFMIDAKHINDALILASAYSQESILYRDKMGECSLIYLDDSRSPMYIGLWTEIMESQAQYQDHTLIDNRYFIARKIS